MGLNFGREALNGPKHIIFILYQYRILGNSLIIYRSYGFLQAVLARYVGVSRGWFSMAAIGRKDL